MKSLMNNRKFIKNMELLRFGSFIILLLLVSPYVASASDKSISYENTVKRW